MEVFVANVVDFASGSRLLIKAGLRNIAVYHHKGRYFAIDNACYHHGGPLLQGDIEELGGHPCVICPWHSYRIALDTGEGMYWGIHVSEYGGLPIQQLKSKGRKQRCHETYVKDGKLYCLVSADGPSLESDNYATMQIANMEEPTGKPVGAVGHTGIHSGLRSGHVLSGAGAPLRGPQASSSSSSNAGSSPNVSNVLLRCIKVIPRCQGVSTFVFEKTEGTVTKRLEPGMWVSLALPCEANREYSTRSYTITSVRSEGGWFGITVKYMKDGRGASKWLHSSGEDLFTAKVPLVDLGGTFTIAKERARINNHHGRLIMISAGIGLTPIFASLSVFLTDQFTISAGPPLHIVHVHVDKGESSVPFIDQLQTWQGLLKGNRIGHDPVTYRFVPVYTVDGTGRPKGDDWARIVEASTFPPSDLTVMLCGPPTFMSNTKNALIALGVPNNFILTESFEG